MSKNTLKLANALLDMTWPISERAMNVFVYLVQKQMAASLLEPDSVAPFIYADRNRLAEVANLKGHNGRLMPIFEELATARFKYENEDGTHKFSAPAISAYEYDKALDCITVEFSRLFWPYLADIARKYTVVDLGVFWFIPGRYAKRFYLDVMRWHGTGEMVLNIANLQERYLCPYLYADIQRRIVEPGIEFIHKMTNVKVHQLPSTKQGKKVISLRFMIYRPSPTETTPWARELVRKYKISPAYAGLIANRLSGRTIGEIVAAIDEAAAAHKVKNLGAYAATFFRNYGLTERNTQKNEEQENNAAAG